MDSDCFRSVIWSIFVPYIYYAVMGLALGLDLGYWILSGSDSCNFQLFFCNKSLRMLYSVIVPI